MNNTLTDIDGLKVGHYTDLEAAKGCTVILCPPGTVAGVDVRGVAPGTRETDLLDPVNTVQTINALLLTGGSAYGLDAAGGVMRWLAMAGDCRAGMPDTSWRDWPLSRLHAWHVLSRHWAGESRA